MYNSTEIQTIDTSVEVMQIDKSKDRYPFCVVWTPIPILTWLFPVIGHTGIALSSGVIRDFAGPYFVSEDNMAFGHPTKYWQLNPNLSHNGLASWDQAVTEASEVYKGRMHNLCCDNCHSHVSLALNLMRYDEIVNWNMFKVAFFIVIYSKYVSFNAFLKTWLPFFILISLLMTFKTFSL